MARPDRPRLRQGRRPALARPRLPRPRRRHVAPGTSLRLTRKGRTLVAPGPAARDRSALAADPTHVRVLERGRQLQAVAGQPVHAAVGDEDRARPLRAARTRAPARGLRRRHPSPGRGRGCRRTPRHGGRAGSRSPRRPARSSSTGKRYHGTPSQRKPARPAAKVAAPSARSQGLIQRVAETGSVAAVCRSVIVVDSAVISFSSVLRDRGPSPRHGYTL